MGYSTIVFKERYKDINQTLYWLVEQAKEGVPYICDKFPKFDTPYQMWNYVKPMLTYKNDPPGVELIQNPHTLFEDNYYGYGKSGSGDCDCFTTLTIALAVCNDWPVEIVLAGRGKTDPSHIYALVDWIVIDFTESNPNQERIYPYVQELPVFWLSL